MYKNYIIILISLVTLNLVKAQSDPFDDTKLQFDTIYVSNVSTTYLIFPDSVEFMDVGSKDNYLAKIKGNTVLLKSTNCDALPTNFIVKHGEMYLHGSIVATIKPPKSLYDYRPKGDELDKITKLNYNKEKLQKSDQEKKELLGHRAKLIQLQTEEDYYKTLGILQDGIFFNVTHIKNSNTGSYFKIKIQNKSSVNYFIDTIKFHISLTGLKKEQYKEELNPLVILNMTNIKPHDVSYILVALPLVSLKNDEKLVINLREKNGSRNITLSIPSNKILSAQNF